MEPENRNVQDDQAQPDAAYRVVRDQLDAIYGSRGKITPPPSGSRPHHPHSQLHTPQKSDDNWQRYHTEWQDYYRRYYEQYYVGHLHQAIQKSEKQEASKSPEEKHREEITDLQHKIAEKAKEKARKARKSRHFIPFASAFVVVLVVAFLQYNQVIIGSVRAYVSPGAIDPQNIVVDPTASVQVGPEPELIIPKINVDVPVIYGVGYDNASQMKAMEKGVAHFAIPGADSVPGQIGNTVISGHSSNDLFDPGDYKFIFAQLEKLQQGDTIFMHYDSVRYTYTVTKKEVVMPNQVDKLTYPTTKPVLTLITCTPLGTAQKRLLVTAEQVAPDPSKAKPAGASKGGVEATMTGTAPTVIERLFGAR